MNKELLVNLTIGLYRLTLLFPKKEPLRYKMRELADDILADIHNQHPVLDNLEILDSYFKVAKEQNWVKLEEILKLQKEYSKIKEELSLSPEVLGVRPLQIFEKSAEARALSARISTRQERILEFLKEQGRAQVWQLKQIFPEISKRTLRRDFEDLLKQGKIERIGERNETFYQLKSV